MSREADSWKPKKRMKIWIEDESLREKAERSGNTGECGGFDQSAMKSEFLVWRW